MLKHGEIWAAIDRLARDHGFTTSGLARRSGLDPTTFNRSKRVSSDGKARWPSTESLSKVLEATGVPLVHFFGLVNQNAGSPQSRTLPMASLSDLAAGNHFDPQGLPTGEHWDGISLAELHDPRAFAVEIMGASLEPFYFDGDVVIVSPSAPARRGDRVLLRSLTGDIKICRLLRRTARRIEVQSLSGDAALSSHPAESVSLLARIVWVSQ
ncbi:MAG TPA: helix-turn-helix transcriptional regulator [Rhodospirillaceae bacterium]|nr:helix-turn-helix transcriptional regulator [Rhodospirillaceae bacterium]